MRIKFVGTALLATVMMVAAPAAAGGGSSIRAAESPVFVDLHDVTVGNILDTDAQRRTRLRRRMATRVDTAAGSGRDGLVTIRLADAVLHYDRLPADARRRVDTADGAGDDAARWYGQRVADLLGGVIDDVRDRRDGAKLAVFDLPISVDASGAVVAAPGFEPLLTDVDGFVTSHAFIVTGGETGESKQVRRALAGLARASAGRPVQFQTNGSWREATDLAEPARFDVFRSTDRPTPSATEMPRGDIAVASPAGESASAPVADPVTNTAPPPPPPLAPQPTTNPFADLLGPGEPRGDEPAQGDGAADPIASPDIEFIDPEAEPEPEAGDTAPTLSHSILHSDSSQGAVTAETCAQLGIEVLPMSIDGLDWDIDGQMTESDAERFMNWINLNVPEDYTGPVCIDYEAPWWVFISKAHVNQYMLAYIMGKYHEGLAFAQAARPNAQWGYWGLPQMVHLAHWDDEMPLLVSLLEAGEVVFPGAYDCMPGNNETDMYRNYLVDSMAAVSGTRPVYAYLNVRFCGMGGDFSQWVPIEELVANANAILEAEWTDESGQVHRPAGIVLWDKYLYTNDVESWSALDAHHADVLEALHAVVTHHAETTYTTPVATAE